MGTRWAVRGLRVAVPAWGRSFASVLAHVLIVSTGPCLPMNPSGAHYGPTFVCWLGRGAAWWRLGRATRIGHAHEAAFFLSFFSHSKTFIFIHKITIHHDTMSHTLIDIFVIRSVRSSHGAACRDGNEGGGGYRGEWGSTGLRGTPPT